MTTTTSAVANRTNSSSGVLCPEHSLRPAPAASHCETPLGSSSMFLAAWLLCGAWLLSDTRFRIVLCYLHAAHGRCVDALLDAKALLPANCIV